MKYLEAVLVDDDPVTHLVHKLAISQSGLDCKVVAFESGEEVLSYLDELSAKNDGKRLMLLDINMPVIDGWDVLDKLSSNEVDVDVIVVSSSINPRDMEKASTYKLVKAFISKPLTKGKLIAAI